MVLMPDARIGRARSLRRRPHPADQLRRARAQHDAGLLARPALDRARAEAYLKATGIADTAFFGPEPEFFIFDQVRWQNGMNAAGFEIDSEEAAWSSNRKYEDGNSGHRPGRQGRLLPGAAGRLAAGHPQRDVQGARSRWACRSKCTTTRSRPPASARSASRFNTLVRKADELMTLKYVVKNVAHRHGKTATFMPKPIVGDNGSGMHVHQSLAKGGTNLFAGDGYGGLSQLALWYIGGIFKHARAINAFTNSTTNSYKRLVPGFEAPVMLAYSARNRSASCRIPWVSSPKARRIEIRFPDPVNSGYLSFAALMMAGLDGIKNKIDPGAPSDKDLYDLPPEEEKNIPKVCHSLDMALEALDADREFLKAGGVFTDDLIDGYIELKMQEVTKFRAATHPLEFQMYYSI